MMNLAHFRPWCLTASRTFLWLVPLPAAGWSQSVPPLLNYQGRVVASATNFQGTGKFKFALVNAGGTTTYWSNDGSELLQVDTYPALVESLAAIKELHAKVRQQGAEAKRLRQRAAELEKKDADYEARPQRLEKAAEAMAK